MLPTKCGRLQCAVPCPRMSLDSSVHSLLESTIYSGPITYGGAYGRPSAHQKGKPSPRLSAE
ncbi:unnamed protein product, partial [Timema podura]|nr:unnamed protein product [Timema podura]